MNEEEKEKEANLQGAASRNQSRARSLWERGVYPSGRCYQFAEGNWLARMVLRGSYEPVAPF